MYSFITRIIVGALALATAAHATEFHVSPAGNDTNPGTSDKCFATPEAASRAIRDLKKSGPLKEPITVILHGGIYHLETTLSFGPDDSGTVEFPITWRAAKNEQAILSGGRVVNTWKEVKINGRTVWQADFNAALLPQGLRSLHINGGRRPRACSKPMVPAAMARDGEDKGQGILLNDAAVAAFARPLDLQVSQQVGWRHYILAVKSIAKTTGNRSEVLLKDTPSKPRSITMWFATFLTLDCS